MEVIKVLLRSEPRDTVLKVVAVMRQGRVVDLDETLAVEAASLAVAQRMPTADSIVLATAQRHAAVVWTQDADFSGKTGVKYFPKTAQA